MRRRHGPVKGKDLQIWAAGRQGRRHWWSASRADNFLTTNPAWNPAFGHFRWEGGANYFFVRVDGFVNPTPAGGGLDLFSYWNWGFADNAALTPAKLVHTGGV